MATKATKSQVSSKGRYKTTKGIIYKPDPRQDGYCTVTYNKKPNTPTDCFRFQASKGS
jgi:hypothetical protein